LESRWGFPTKLIRPAHVCENEKRRQNGREESKFPNRIFDLYASDAGPLNIGTRALPARQKSQWECPGLLFPAIALVKIYWLSADEEAIEWTETKRP
jgi:hypothetical protein